MESKQKTAWPTLGVVGVAVSRPENPVSQNWFRLRDNHFRFDGDRKYCRMNSQVNNLKANGWQKSTPGDL